jgi:membrane protein
MPPTNWQKRLIHELWENDLNTQSPARRFAIRLARIVYGIIGNFTDGQFNLRAGSLAYTSLLALVPFLAVSFSILKAFGAHNELEPLLMELLAPLGEQGREVGTKILDFVSNLKVGVLGSVGIALLFYTVISLIHKVEQAFNEMWQVTTDRPLARRFSDYLSVILIGPVLIFAALGLANTAMDSPIIKHLATIQPLDHLILSLNQLATYLLIAGAFAFLYGFLPNTRVCWKAALIGGAFASVLWFTSGKIFARFVVSSSNYSAIYSGFAGAVLFIIWLYVGWLIILVGGQITAYWQNPDFLDPRRGKQVLSNRQREKLVLEIMTLIGRAHYYNDSSWTLETLQKRYQGFYADAVERVVGLLVQQRLIVASQDEPPFYLPSRDIETIGLNELLGVVRDAKSQPLADELPAVMEILGQTDAAIAQALENQTLKTLVLETATQ